jgi:hypothetical protein
MTDDGESMRVQLARMEGKLDLSNLRHDQTDAWKGTVDQRLNRHSNDISSLQAIEHQRKGVGKLIHWLSGGGVVAVGAAVARHFGL